MTRTMVLMLWTALTAASAMAQEATTRAETDRQRRSEKNEHLKPYAPGGFERTMHFVEEKAVFIVGREGLYPKAGSLTTGSGFALGPGYRDRDLFRNRGTLDLWAAASRLGYWAAEGRLAFPKLAHNRVMLETWAAHRDYPQEDFFGLGPTSARADQTSYAIRTDTVGAKIGVRPHRTVLAGVGVDYLQPTLGSGTDRLVPSIEARFDAATAPGLGESTTFVRSTALLEIDYREPKNARRGGWYRLDLSRFADRDGGFSFNRVDVDLRQYVGFLAERRVLAGRMWMSTSEPAAGAQVPFYLMPTLGGNDTLRGFRNYRFRAPHALLLQGEYRWEIWSGLDGALFYDAGKVANRRADLGFTNLERDYGFGFRFNTDEAIMFRVDAGFGSRDGKHLYIVFGGIF